MGAGCTVQCSTAQAPIELRIPVSAASFEVNYFFAHRAIRDPAYVPLVPPPIV